MTSQNPSRKNAKPVSNPNDSGAPKAAKASEITRQLTDEEIAAVAGGGGIPVKTGGPQQ
jgi:carbamate kinase